MKNYINTVLTLALLCATPCLAKKNDVNTSTDVGCPVEITNGGVSHTLLNGSLVIYHAYADYRNHTDKKIIGVIFSLDVMDAVGDWSDYAQDLGSDSSVKPGKKNVNNSWDIYPGQASGGRIYVRKIDFVDGTTWTDDGTKKCQFVRDNR